MRNLIFILSLIPVGRILYLSKYFYRKEIC